jgi:hypothetical protein
VTEELWEQLKLHDFFDDMRFPFLT